MSQPKKLLIALISAVVLGLCLHPFADAPWLIAINNEVLKPLGQIFLRFILMVVVPLVFSALVIATNELGQSQGLGKIAAKTMGFTLLISTLSVVIGISLVNIIKPGQNFHMSDSLQQNIHANVSAKNLIEEQASKTKPFSQILVELLPKNPIDSAAKALDGEIIPLMIFALIFGIAMSTAATKNITQTNVLIPIFNEIFNASMGVIHFAMKLAPFGVFALIFNTVFIRGIDILFSLFFYVTTVILGLLIQQFLVYSSFLKLFAKRNPWQFFSACKEVYLYAFSTSSSNASLPKALETAETKLHIPSHVSRFVLTVGASANQNGTAIFEGITVLFLAQVYGVDLTLGQQIYVVVFSILAGIGTAGVPGGSLPLIMVLLQSVGIPPESIGLILGVDRFLDMCRTTINVSGDLVIAALVAPKQEAALEANEPAKKIA